MFVYFYVSTGKRCVKVPNSIHAQLTNIFKTSAIFIEHNEFSFILHLSDYNELANFIYLMTYVFILLQLYFDVHLLFIY